MLSAAHVLAMDAKNLLDVVDSVRVRYPELFTTEEIHVSSSISLQSSDISEPIHSAEDQEKSGENFPVFTNARSSNNCNEDCVEQQAYQNLTEITENPLSIIRDEIYVNQEQIQPTQKIYDNDSIVSAQLKSRSIDLKAIKESSKQSTKIESLTTTKPPVAVKPGKLSF